MFIAGIDAQSRFMVQAYDAKTGTLQWDDRVDDGAGQAAALTLGGGQGEDSAEDSVEDSDRRLFATGIVGCDPTFFECELAVRAYDPRRGLVWQRADQARGGDWAFLAQSAAGAGQLFVLARELLEDGQYHSTVRSYAAKDGALLSATPFDEGGSGNPLGFVGAVSVLDGRLFVGGGLERSDGGLDFVLRSYQTR